MEDVVTNTNVNDETVAENYDNNKVMKFDKVENSKTYNQQIVRETIMAEESQKNADTDYTSRQAVLINLRSKEDHRTNGILHRAI